MNDYEKNIKALEREVDGLKKSHKSGARVPKYIDHYPKSNDTHTPEPKFFLVQQYIEGENLSTKPGADDEKQIFTYLIDLLETLHLIHKNGILHRDIKPQNIIINKQAKDRNKCLYLVDFGACKLLDYNLKSDELGGLESRKQDVTRPIIRTDSYAPPEILVKVYRENQPEEYFLQDFVQNDSITKYLQARDIYSLGMTICDLIYKKMPKPIIDNDDNSDERLRIPSCKKWTDAMKEVRNLAPNIYCIVDKMLRYYPDERYQTAIEVLLDASTQAWYTYEQDDFWLLQGQFLLDADNCKIPKTKQHKIFLEKSWDKAYDGN
jgi:serine/threonine protein kinase